MGCPPSTSRYFCYLLGSPAASWISTLVDSMLGYVPAEFGPVYRFAEMAQISRFRTLLVKWALWAYGVFTIVAVGVTSTSMITRIYDVKGFHRLPGAVEAAVEAAKA